jgi:hypothetical protein
MFLDATGQVPNRFDYLHGSAPLLDYYHVRQLLIRGKTIMERQQVLRLVAAFLAVLPGQTCADEPIVLDLVPTNHVDRCLGLHVAGSQAVASPCVDSDFLHRLTTATPPCPSHTGPLATLPRHRQLPRSCRTRLQP